MGFLCLSQALILRCESLNRIQDLALFIPTCVEFLFASSLIYKVWRSDRILVLLMFEGWTYFALALLELLSHFLSAVRDNLQVFKVIDIALGAFSSLPLLFYTFFLCLFTWTRLMDDIPQWLRRLGRFLMVVLIPVAVALNAISSFIGITHRSINFSVEVGFSTVQNKTLWTLFTDLDIGFITGYQMLHFLFAFLRLANAFLEQGRIESTDADEALLFRGTGWIVMGIKLGVIETAIAFVPPRFGTTLARRILRAVGRGSLIFGLYKGLDVSEDFQQVREEIQAGKQNRSFRGSRIRPLSSDRRFSVLRRFSPETNTNALETISEKDTPPNTPMPPGQRVTVRFDSESGKAPTLQMRFSALDMPSPVEIVESIKFPPDEEWMTHSRKSSYYANSTMTRQTIGMSDMPSSPPLPFPPVSGELPLQNVPDTSAHTRSISNFGVQFGGVHGRDSESSWTHSVVKNLASQFPPLPPSTPTAASYEPILQASPSTSNAPLTPSHSLRRKPPPRASLVPIDPFTEEDAEAGIRLPTPLESSEHIHQMGLALAPPDTDTWVIEDSGFEGRPGSPESLSLYSTSPTAEGALKYEGESGSRARLGLGIEPSELAWLQEDTTTTTTTTLNRGKSIDSSMFQRPESEEYDVGYTEEPAAAAAEGTKTRRSTSGSRSSRKSRSRTVGRIKSVGSAPRRRTPSLTQSSYVRDSVYIEPMFIAAADDPRGYSGVEVEQGTLDSSVPLRDSGVLGSDESREFRAI